MKRPHRRLAAWCALLAISFVQIATAAHACGLVDPASKAPATQASGHVRCAEMDMGDAHDRPVLCLEHCKSGLQLVDHHSPVSMTDVAVTVPLIVDTPFHADTSKRTRELFIAPGTAPPVFASSSRLRI